jgi:hypothetical protein
VQVLGRTLPPFQRLNDIRPNLYLEKTCLLCPHQDSNTLSINANTLLYLLIECSDLRQRILPKKAYPGPDLRIVAAKVADKSRAKSRKIAEGCGWSRKVAEGRKRCHGNRSFTRSFAMILIKARNVAKQSHGKSRKVAESRATSRATVATFRSRIGLQKHNARGDTRLP